MQQISFIRNISFSYFFVTLYSFVYHSFDCFYTKDENFKNCARQENKILTKNFYFYLKKEIFIYDQTLKFFKHPWRKYRIGIHSEPIRTTPIHSDTCIRANANHSKPIRIGSDSFG